MPLLTRRELLQKTSATLLALPLGSRFLRADTSIAGTLTLHSDQPGPRIPENFIGLSYETQQLADPNFFSGENRGLISKFQELTPRGVLRLGGNTSDVGWFRFAPQTQRPAMQTRRVIGEPSSEQAYFIVPEAIHNLRSFLDATGWTCIYGLNLGTGSPERDAEEAALVASALGDKLEYFQVGNEPDLFDRHQRDPKTWTVDTYLDEWLAVADAVRSRVPHASFGLPDTSGNPEWSARIVARLSSLPDGNGKGTRPRIAAITHHYYFGGPPSNPDVNIERLLHTDPRVERVAATTKAAATQLSAASKVPVPYRMSEGNTCYRGGKPGVSDVFAAALWAADYCLTLASLGYHGVNLHGGTRNQVAASLGGILPGEELLANPNEPHPRPFYTPIAEIDGKYVSEPVFFGMRFAGQFAGAKVIPVTLKAEGVNATAYAAQSPNGKTLIAIINKDANRPFPIQLEGLHVVRTLAADSLTSAMIKESSSTSPSPVSSVPAATAMLFTK